MSQVLEKPILLDETGQAIAGKLDTNSAAIVSKLNDIKDAIGTSGEFIPLMIKVVTPPTKTVYKVGERLDLTGMVVNLIASNGTVMDVTSACTFVPADGTVLTTSDTSVAISYLYLADNLTFTTSQAITIKELSSIAVTTPPTKTAYAAGEALDLTGIVVSALYSDGTTENVTMSCVFNPANGTILSSGDSSVAISYTENGATKTTSVAIGVKDLSSIAITTPPTKTTYVSGETLDLTGIVVTATFDDSSTADVTALCTFSPANGATLSRANTTVTASYTVGSTTKTATQSLDIIAVFGISRDTNSSDSEWNRTDDAVGFNFTASVGSTAGSSDFDNCYPWSEMERVTISGDVFVKIPKFWFKRNRDANGIETIKIATGEATGFTLHPAFNKAGTIYDYIYVSAYQTTTGYTSKTGMATLSEDNGYTVETNMRNKGNGYHCWDIATLSAIQMLILVEIADYNMHDAIGNGFYENSSLSNSGTCDNVPNLTGAPSGTDGKTGVVWRGLENLWGNLGAIVLGVKTGKTSSNVYYYSVCNDPSKYTTQFSSDDGFTQLDHAVPLDGFVCLTGFYENNPAYMLPEERNRTGSSMTTYVCAWVSGANEIRNMIAISGKYNDGITGSSLFTTHGSIGTYAYSGSRILLLPTA